MPDLPGGLVTFLFTDVEGSTKLLNAHPDAYRRAVKRHHDVLAEAVAVNHGVVFETVGDAVYAAFVRPTDATAAALWGQLALQAESWGETPIQVRIGVHLGEVEIQGSHYFGAPLYRCARLMAAAHGGQVVLSAAVAEAVRDTLDDSASLWDLGEHRLKDLARPEHIFQLIHPDLPVDFPPLRTLDTLPNNLPRQSTLFIGREREADIVSERLLHSDVQLVSLLGPGGTGKTRLALHVAAHLLDHFSAGTYFVPLEPVGDPALVLPAIAHALGVREVAGRPLVEGVKDFLREKQLLLVLDNFEQVIDAAPTVAELLRAAPHVKALVTSRFALRVSGEREYHVPALTLPDLKNLPPLDRLTQFEGVRLFIERAQAVKTDFQVTNDNAPAVAEICHRLDGLPLAIELAAARTRLFPPQAMLARLESTSGGLALLTGGARDLPRRQQTLRDAIVWSYDLLESSEQQLFCRFGVFAGGFTVDAAEAVGSATGDLDVLAGLDSLVEKSLLRQNEHASGEPRFGMLETLREFAREQLSASDEERQATLERHAAYFAALAARKGPQLVGASQSEALECFTAERENMRAALRWHVEAARAEGAILLVSHLGRFWELLGPVSEGRAWTAAALAVPNDGSPAATRARSVALVTAGLLAGQEADFPAQEPLLREALALCRRFGDRGLEAIALSGLARVAAGEGQFAEARELVEQSVVIFRELGQLSQLADTLAALAYGAVRDHDFDRARLLVDDALSAARQVGHTAAIGSSFTVLALLAQAEERYAEATGWYEKARALQRQGGNVRGVAAALLGLADVALDASDLDHAEAFAREAEIVGAAGPSPECQAVLAAIALERGDAATAGVLARQALGVARSRRQRFSVQRPLWAMAGAVAMAGDGALALRLAGLASSLPDPHPLARTTARVRRQQRWLDAARKQLDESAQTAAWAAGQAWTVELAIDLALAETTPDAAGVTP